MPRKINDRAPARRRRPVSNALDVPLRHNDGGVHRRRVGNSVDQIRVDENQRIIRHRLSAARNRRDRRSNHSQHRTNPIEAKELYSLLVSFRGQVAQTSVCGFWSEHGRTSQQPNPQTEVCLRVNRVLLGRTDG